MYIVTETSKLCTVTGTITLAVVATNKKKRHQGQITFIWSGGREVEALLHYAFQLSFDYVFLDILKLRKWTAKL